MKIIDTAAFSLGIGFFIIGIYEAFVVGILYSYWWFMVSAALMLFYSYRKRSLEQQDTKKPNKKTNSRR